MKLKDIINSLPETAILPDQAFHMLEDVYAEFGLLDMHRISSDNEKVFNSRVTVKYITRWYCTSAHLGIHPGTYVYFFDNMPFLMTSYHHSNCPKSNYPLNREALNAFIFFAKSLSKPDSHEYSLIDMEEDFGEGYKLASSHQILSSHGYYKNQRVRIVKIYSYPYINNIIGVENSSGEYIEVYIQDLLFKFGE